MHRQISNCRQHFEAKTQEGHKLISNSDRPSKPKTIYQRLLKLDESLCEYFLLRKRVNILCDLELFERYEVKRRNLLQTLKADCLQYLHAETNMTDRQIQTAQLTSDAEPTAAKTSESVVVVSQRTVENGNAN